MLPYRRQGEIDYAALEFDPFEREVPPDAMEQNPAVLALFNLLSAWITNFSNRPDIFLDTGTFICYDRRNLNVRVAPDIYISFGVDSEAIRSRGLYLPWEAGKPPDLAMEVASESTAQRDIRRKPEIYAEVRVPEYWLFDPTGGDYYGQPLTGYRLVGGVYQQVHLTTEPDGILKGHSEVLGLSICWHEGLPLLYDPSAVAYLSDWQQERAELEAERAARLEAQAEVRRLREMLRRQSQS